MRTYYKILTLFIVISLGNTNASAEKMDTYQIYSSTKPQDRIHIKYPTWFKSSFLDLQEDLNDAREKGKRGIILFVSQENCNHCQAFIEATLKDPAVNKRLLANYDVIGMEIFSDLEVTDIDGTVAPVKDFAEKQRALLTPTVLFYGVENVRLLRIIGFYPPEKFQQVLDYIEDGYYSKIKLSEYLRSKQIKTNNVQNGIAQKGILLDDTLFSKPPYDLADNLRGVKRPTMVLFETPNCNACKRFHDRVLADTNVRKTMSGFHAIQLDATDNSTQLTMPDGRQLTPKQWSEELQLAYDVSVVFFDEQGNEVFRNDAETGKQRMVFTMEYVLEKGYQEEKQVNRWRREKILNHSSAN